MHPEEALQKAVNRRDFIAGTTSGVLGVLTMEQPKNTQGATGPGSPAARGGAAGGQSLL